LLETSGYDGLRMHDVAREAGVGLATIYRRWPTKRDLLLDVLDLDDLLPAFAETDDPRADLAGAIRTLAELVGATHPALLPGRIAAGRDDADVDAALRATVLHRLEDRLRILVERAGGPGLPHAAMRARLVAAYFTYCALFDADALDPDEVIERLLPVLLDPAPPGR
jgi:AcrR family transcriptional regulator